MASESTTDLLKRLTDLISDGRTTVTIKQVEFVNGAARGVPPMVGIEIIGPGINTRIADPDAARALDHILGGIERRPFRRKRANLTR
jgi:hypothetical protein